MPFNVLGETRLCFHRRRANHKWIDENIVAVVLDFDDEVLGAPAYPGLLYLLSTHRRLANVSDAKCNQRQ